MPNSKTSKSKLSKNISTSKTKTVAKKSAQINTTVVSKKTLDKTHTTVHGVKMRIANQFRHKAHHEDDRDKKRKSNVNFMKNPSLEHAFEVGDTVEVYCDHEKNGDRIRGWLKGIVVQVDHKMVAVQFRSNVFLTDGWMVPDRILWYPLTSDQIRGTGTSAKKSVKIEIPNY